MTISAYLDHIKIHKISLTLAVTAVFLYMSVLLINPGLFAQSISAWVRFSIFFLPFVVAIIGILGILDTYLPAEAVSKYLGDKRRIHGYLFALLFGTMVGSSQYAIFPTIKMLRSKGARTAILATFLVVWSGISLPVIPLELQLFGAKFVALRLGIIFLSALVFGVITGVLNIHMER